MSSVGIEPAWRERAVRAARLGSAGRCQGLSGLWPMQWSAAVSSGGPNSLHNPTLFTYYTGLDDKYRLYAIGGFAVVGTASAAVATGGMSLEAEGQLAPGLMRIAIGPGAPFHVAFAADGTMLNAVGDFGAMRISQAFAADTFSGAWASFSVPVLSTSAVTATEGSSAWTCVTGAASAFARGMGF